MRTLRFESLWQRVLGVLLIGALFVPATAQPVAAHTPHDVIPDIAVSPNFADDQTVFVISRNYLLRSQDGGATWHRLARGIDSRLGLTSVAVTPADPDTLYASSSIDAVFKSTDGGDSWERASVGMGSNRVRLVEVSPHSADIAIAAGTDDRAWRTNDGGESWTQIPELDQELLSIHFVRDDPNAVFAGDASGRVWRSSDRGESWDFASLDAAAGATRTIIASPEYSQDNTLYLGTEFGGVWRSVDGGAAFEPVGSSDSGLTDPEIIDVTITSRADGSLRLWASTTHDGVFVSDDDGTTWRLVSEGLTKDEMADRLGRPNFGRFAAATDNADEVTMFVASFDGLFKSTNLSEGWSYADTQVPSNIAGLAVSPNFATDQTIAVATYINGALISRDAGANWEPINSGLATEFEWGRRADYVARMTGIAFYPSYADDQRMFAGLRAYYLESEDSGESWSATIPPGMLVEDEFPADYYVPAFSPDFAEDQTLILGTDGGKVLRSVNGTESIEIIANNGREFTALVMSPGFGVDSTLFGGTPSGMIRSTDGGLTWEDSGELNRYVYSVAVSPTFAADQTAWAGTRSGLFVTTDGGAEWSRINEELFGWAASIQAIVVSPDYAEDSLVLVSVSGLGLFKSTDGGMSFVAVAPELLENHVVLGSFYHPTTEPIVFSPTFAQDQTVFGYAEEQVYRSTDAGESWTELELPVSLHDTTVAPEGPLRRTPRYDPAFPDGIDPALFDASDDFNAKNNRSNTPVDKPNQRRIFDTPLGFLSYRRIAFAIGVAGAGLAALLAVPALRRHDVLSRWWVRLLLVGGALLAALAILAW